MLNCLASALDSEPRAIVAVAATERSVIRALFSRLGDLKIYHSKPCCLITRPTAAKLIFQIEIYTTGFPFTTFISSLVNLLSVAIDC